MNIHLFTVRANSVERAWTFGPKLDGSAEGCTSSYRLDEASSRSAYESSFYSLKINRVHLQVISTKPVAVFTVSRGAAQGWAFPPTKTSVYST